MRMRMRMVQMWQKYISKKDQTLLLSLKLSAPLIHKIVKCVARLEEVG